jgi:hypothetical protein
MTMKNSLSKKIHHALAFALAALLFTGCQTLEYRQIQNDFNQSVEADNTGNPFAGQHTRVLESLTPEYIGKLEAKLRPNAWMLRSVSAWRVGSNEVATAAARAGLKEPTLVAGSRDQVVLEMIPALVIDSDLNRRWIEAGRTLTGTNYAAIYETNGFVQAWRQLSGPASQAIKPSTPDEVVAYFHYQRWRLILNWTAVIGSIKPNEEFVTAQARACTILNVQRDPLFAAQKEVEQIPDSSPFARLVKAQGWTPPLP